jgi:hypothetical protein
MLSTPSSFAIGSFSSPMSLQDPRPDFLLEVLNPPPQQHNRDIELVSDVIHMGRRERSVVRSFSHDEHLFYERGDALQFHGDVLPLCNCTARGGDRNSFESLPHVRHGATNSRFKQLFVIVLMKVKLVKRFLGRISRFEF